MTMQVDNDITSYNSTVVADNQMHTIEKNMTDESAPTDTNSKKTFVPGDDFGHVIDCVDQLTDEEKLIALNSGWRPSHTEEFPVSYHMKQGKQRSRSLNSGHLERYKWLAVSRVPGKIGAWCSTCVTFSVRQEHRGNPINKLVLIPLTDFSDLTGKQGALDRHERSGFHVNNAARAAEFLQRARSSKLQVDKQISTQKADLIKRNRKILSSIVETVKFAAMQNLPFRGRRDDGRISSCGSYPKENDGNLSISRTHR